MSNLIHLLTILIACRCLTFLLCLSSIREEEMYELLKAKRNADSHFRKIRLAYEGPKNPSRSKSGDKKKESDSAEDKESEKPDEKGSKENKENSDDMDEESPKFKPTATKRQFVSDGCFSLTASSMLSNVHANSFRFTGDCQQSAAKGARRVR